MPFSTLLLSVATVGTTTLAFAIATPASAQEKYAHKHYAHTHYAHARYRHYAHYEQVVRSLFMRNNQRQCRARATPGVPWRRSATSWVEPARPCREVFTGAGAVVGGVRGRSVWRRVGALRLSAELHIRRLVRRAVQCDRGSRRSAVPVGERRSRSAAARPSRLLSQFRLLSGPFDK